MTSKFQTVISFADGESKIVGSKAHEFIIRHPVTAAILALIVGLTVGLLL